MLRCLVLCSSPRKPHSTAPARVVGSWQRALGEVAAVIKRQRAHRRTTRLPAPSAPALQRVDVISTGLLLRPFEGSATQLHACDSRLCVRPRRHE